MNKLQHLLGVLLVGLPAAMFGQGARNIVISEVMPQMGISPAV